MQLRLIKPRCLLLMNSTFYNLLAGKYAGIGNACIWRADDNVTTHHFFSCIFAERTLFLFYWCHLHIKPLAKGKKEGGYVKSIHIISPGTWDFEVVQGRGCMGEGRKLWTQWKAKICQTFSSEEFVSFLLGIKQAPWRFGELVILTIESLVS